MVINNNQDLVKNRFNGSSTCPRKEESTFVMNVIPLLVNEELGLSKLMDSVRKRKQSLNIMAVSTINIVVRITTQPPGARLSKEKTL